MHWSISPRLTLPPCWNRIIVSPFLIMKMERDEGILHPALLLGWWKCCKSPRNFGDEHWHPPRPCHRTGFATPYWWELVFSSKLPSPTFVSGLVLTLLLDGAEKLLMHFWLAIYVGSCGNDDPWNLSTISRTCDAEDPGEENLDQDFHIRDYGSQW
jgi:hypothetical protein